MLAYYTGEKSEGVELLDRATRPGLESKMFDLQALLLLAFARLDNNAPRERYRTSAQHSHLGEHTGAVATPGGVSMPAGYKPPSADGLLGSPA